MPKKSYTKEQEKIVIEQYATVKNQALCELLGINLNVLRKIAFKYKIKKNKMDKKFKVNICAKFTDDDIEFLRKYYPSNGVQFCAKKLNLKNTQIKYKVGSLGIKLNDRGKILRSNDGVRKKHNNKLALFQPVFNNKQSYALGLLWADGWLHQTKTGQAKSLYLQVVEDDYIDFHDALQSLGKVSVSNRTTKNRRSQCCAYINNYGLCEWLSNVDFFDKSIKSPEKLLSFIPNEFLKDFLRGYIDGDGCFYINEKNRCYQFSLAGAYDQDWSTISNILNSLNIKHSIKSRHQLQNGKLNGSSRIVFCGVKKIRKLVDFIYTDSLNYLKRKYEKAMKIYNINDHGDHGDQPPRMF
jgi:hypothetical protein